MIVIRNTRPDDAEALAALQQAVFPTLDPQEWFTADQYRAQVTRFPEGQFVALWNGRVVGATTTMRTRESFLGEHPPHYFTFIGGGELHNHDPEGDWLYGIDVSVHPDYRRRGIASRLYDARRDLVERLGLRGEIVAALMPGYADHKRSLTAEQYLERVARGDLIDPTLTAQKTNGFKLVRVLRGYVTDARSDDCCALIVRYPTQGFRPALPEEAPLLEALMHRSKAYWRFSESVMVRIRAAMRLTPQQIRDAAAVVVLELHGEIKGFYHFKHTPDGLLLEDLFLEPDVIGDGHGRRLFEHAVQTARSLGANRFHWESEPYAEEFYLRMGGRRTGTRYSAVTNRDMPLMEYLLSPAPSA